MKIIVFIFSTLISFSALADFNGVWTGQGDLTDSEGNSQACKTMSFDLTQTDTKFSMNSGNFDCDLFKMKWVPFSLDIQDGELFSNGVRVGSISADFIFARQQAPDSKLISIYQAELTDMSMNYKETVIDDAGNILFSAEGILNK